MPLHQRVEAVEIERLAAFLGELLCKLDREPVRRHQREGVVCADRVLPREVVEHLRPARERLGELLLLGTHDALDVGGVLAQHRVGGAHLVDDDRGKPVHPLEPDPLRLVDRAPQETPADVSAPLVGGLDALCDQERDGAAVVGEDAVRPP